MNYTEQNLQHRADTIWLDAIDIFPKLAQFVNPRITLSNRLTKTAGYCSVADNLIVLSNKLLVIYGLDFINEILPHELGHQIDFNLYGMPKNNRWHRQEWVTIGLKLGYSFKTYHGFEL